MKVNIEFSENGDRRVEDENFSLSISQVPVVNMNVLEELYKMVERAYLDYYKMKYKQDMPDEGIDFIRSNPQGIE